MACTSNGYRISVEKFDFKKNLFQKRPDFMLSPRYEKATGKVNATNLQPGEKAIFVSFSVTIENTEKEPTPFDLHALVRGIFIVDEKSSEQDACDFLDTYGTQIVFPYLRSLVSSLTAAAMIPSLQLPLISPDDFGHSCPNGNAGK
jgi:preprotein translocase subunit SecB